MSGRWTRAERLVTLNLYFKVPFGRQDRSNEKIRKFAERLGRSPSAVAMKLNNFAAVDHTLDRKGLENVAAADEQLWEEYWGRLDELGRASEAIWEILEKTGRSVSDLPDDIHGIESVYGKSVSAETERRLGQKFFRSVILQNYREKCAVCGLSRPCLLDAAHIVGWSETEDANMRVDPRNGLALCKIHHAAFDERLIGIEPDSLEVRVSDRVNGDTRAEQEMLVKYSGVKVQSPEKFAPSKSALHRQSKGLT